MRVHSFRLDAKAVKLQKVVTAELENMPTKQPGQDRHSYGCTTWCIDDCDDSG